jgi:hypothetical protein
MRLESDSTQLNQLGATSQYQRFSGADTAGQREKLPLGIGAGNGEASGWDCCGAACCFGAGSSLGSEVARR